MTYRDHPQSLCFDRHHRLHVGFQARNAASTLLVKTVGMTAGLGTINFATDKFDQGTFADFSGSEKTPLHARATDME